MSEGEREEKMPSEWLKTLSSPYVPLSSLTSAIHDFPSFSQWPESLQSFVIGCKSLAMPREPQQINSDYFALPASVIDPIQDLDPVLCVGMKEKKIHEVKRLSNVIQGLCGDFSEVVDVGSGVGYIAQALSHHFGYHVIGLEGNEGQHERAAARFEKTEKRRRVFERVFDASKANPHSSTLEPDPNTLQRDLYLHHPLSTSNPSEPQNISSHPPSNHLPPSETRLLHSTVNFMLDYSLGSAGLDAVVAPKLQKTEDICLMSLHACGDLSPIIIELFASWTRAKRLVNVGCCYHKMSSKRSNNDSLKIGHDDSNHESLDSKESNESLTSNSNNLYHPTSISSNSHNATSNPSNLHISSNTRSNATFNAGNSSSSASFESNLRGFPLSSSISLLLSSLPSRLEPQTLLMELGTGCPHKFKAITATSLETRINQIEFRSLIAVFIRHLAAQIPEISQLVANSHIHVQKMKGANAFKSLKEYLKVALPRTRIKPLTATLSTLNASSTSSTNPSTHSSHNPPSMDPTNSDFSSSINTHPPHIPLSSLIPDWSSFQSQVLLLSDSHPSALPDRRETNRNIIRAWLSLEACLTSVAESLILLDRWLYLEEMNDRDTASRSEQEESEKSHPEKETLPENSKFVDSFYSSSSSVLASPSGKIVAWILPIFDQEESPRNLAVLALKEP